ncbi:protein PLASTID MOVEMENT IMPAIRED 2 [Dorcoceras hygrometricum]|uniref:Protein PLASTID MOVEMENT IMPAIRED 2 n=1 Tax=Dorcoceras hygrometricum TaxID=472368 RepID=A0A2Z7C4M1_9LAMI|nr:protein PLASTID MOVEMENT IMPAIRED 2 [Dorcoceras hygrometricum]
MVVDLIGIYGLKGPYCTLTTTNWFLQALSVIPRGSWGDVARRSYHDSMGKSGIVIPEPQCTIGRRPSPLSQRAAAAASTRRRRLHAPPPPPLLRRKIVSDQFNEENPSAQISSSLLVQADEGIPPPVVDLIGVIYRNLPATVEDQAVEKADEVERWFDLPYEVLFARDTEQMVTIASDTDEDFIADQVFGTGVEKMETEAVEQSADEAMSLEDILMTISVDFPLPSAGVEITKITLGETITIPGVNEGDWNKASLPKISATDKGKAPLQDRDPVKGNPIKEQFSLILADIEVLVQLREKIIEDVDRFFNSFSLKSLATLKIDESYFDKEALILSWAETDSTRVALNKRTYILTKYRELSIRKFLEARKINFIPGEGSSATDLKVLEMLYDLHMFVVEDLKEQTMAHGLRWEKTCCSKIFEGRPRDPDDSSMHFDDNDTADTSISLPPAAIDVIESLARLRASIDQVRFDEQDRVHRALHKDTHDQKNLLSLDLKSTHQKLSAQIAAVAFDTEDVRNEVKEINAKATYLDGKIVEIRSEQLDFRAKTEENYLNLSTQLGLIVDERGKVVAAAPNHLLTIKADPSGEMVAVVLGKVVAEVEVVVEAIGVYLPREDIPAVVVDRSEDRLKIG